MNVSRRASTAAGAILVAATLGGAPQVARADTASTVAIAAGAAAIVGALLYDSSNHPYYVRDGHRYYVTQDEARYYRSHHPGGRMRQAYVPEREYPVARDPYHGNPGRGGARGNAHAGHGDDHHH
jgi:hypothetical protein